MDINSLLSGAAGEYMGGLALAITLLVGASVMAWIRGKGWSWVPPLLYGLVTATCLFSLFSGVLVQGGILSRVIFSVVLALSLGVVWYVDTNSQKWVVVPTTVQPQPSLPAVVLVMEQIYINEMEEETYPLKLHIIWANQGGEVHLGKPRWVANKVAHQGHRLGQALMSRYRVKGGTDCEEVTAKPGQRGDLWLALDPDVGVVQSRDWRNVNKLGVLVLPYSIRGIKAEMKIQL